MRVFQELRKELLLHDCTQVTEEDALLPSSKSRSVTRHLRDFKEVISN